MNFFSVSGEVQELKIALCEVLELYRSVLVRLMKTLLSEVVTSMIYTKPNELGGKVGMKIAIVTLKKCAMYYIDYKAIPLPQSLDRFLESILSIRFPE